MLRGVRLRSVLQCLFLPRFFMMYLIVNPNTSPGAKPNPAATQLKLSSSSSSSDDTGGSDSGDVVSLQTNIVLLVY